MGVCRKTCSHSPAPCSLTGICQRTISSHRRDQAHSEHRCRRVWRCHVAVTSSTLIWWWVSDDLWRHLWWGHTDLHASLPYPDCSVPGWNPQSISQTFCWCWGSWFSPCAGQCPVSVKAVPGWKAIDWPSCSPSESNWTATGLYLSVHPMTPSPTTDCPGAHWCFVAFFCSQQIIQCSSVKIFNFLKVFLISVFWKNTSVKSWI